MSNYTLICHGDLIEFSSFELGYGQEVHYRGNFGAALGYKTALAIWQQIRSDPTVSDSTLTKLIDNYAPEKPLVGPGAFAPNIMLEGDDKLFLFLINMNNKRYVRLGSGWSAKLSSLVGFLGRGRGESFWLNLLCCTEFDDSGVSMPDGTKLYSEFQDIL